MSGISCGTFPSTAEENWTPVEADAQALNTDINGLNTFVQSLATDTQEMTDVYDEMNVTLPLLIAEQQFYAFPFERRAIGTINMNANSWYNLCNFDYEFAPNAVDPALPVAFCGAVIQLQSTTNEYIEEVFIRLVQYHNNQVLETSTTWGSLNNTGLITANFSAVIINNTGAIQRYSVDIYCVSPSGRVNQTTGNSYTWLMPMAIAV